MQHTRAQRGFTLIEMAIVMAIGALMIAAVIIAINGAQRDHREKQRKDMAATMTARLTTWASNHSKHFPTTAEEKSSFEHNTLRDLTNPATGQPYEGDLSWYAFSQDASGTASGTDGVMAELEPDQIAIIVPPTGSAFACVGLETAGNYCTGHAKLAPIASESGGGGGGGGGGPAPAAPDTWTGNGAGTSGCSGDCRVVGTAINSNHAPFRVEYQTGEMDGGDYTLQIDYTNNGTLPPPNNYSYRVNIYVNGARAISNKYLPAPATNQPASQLLTITLPPRSSAIRVEWTNDRYSAGRYDANFQINALTVSP